VCTLEQLVVKEWIYQKSIWRMLLHFIVVNKRIWRLLLTKKKGRLEKIKKPIIGYDYYCGKIKDPYQKEVLLVP
jgi:hypothetical protein